MLLAACLAQAGEAAAPAPAAAPPAPAAAPAKVTALVKIVEGTVESRPGVGQPWAAVQAGMSLAEGADLRTGFRARCVLDMTESLVQVGPLTVVRIGELRQEGGRIRARVVMKQGSAQADVVKKAVTSDFALVTPSATISVRGTQGISCQFFPDLGGRYGLTQSGLIGVTGGGGRSTGVQPSQGTDDAATWPLWLVAIGHEPPVLDLQALSSEERWAAMRWDTSTPVPAGLNGPNGSPIFLLNRIVPVHSSQYIGPGDYTPPTGRGR